MLRKLAEFQQAGHKVVLIIGDYTARVGDPSGRSELRPMLSPEQIDENAATFQSQALKILDADPERLEVRHNGEWLDMPMAELLGLVRTTTAAQLLERDDFAKRWSANEPISLLELLYPLLQAYDSVAIDADVELGGTDQKFNLLLGRDIQRAYGKPEQAILTMPLLVGIEGQRKMSKSLGNQIGVTDRAAGDLRQDDVDPRRGDRRVPRACCSSDASTPRRAAAERPARCAAARRRRAARRVTPSARSRASSWPGCTPSRTRRTPSATSSACSSSTTRRRRSPRRASRATAPACTCRR